MAEWVKVGASVVVGGAAGAVDQLVQNADDKREAEKGEKLPIMQQYGTYLNYGVPILGILLTAFGVLKGDWATRVVTAGSTLAGRKITLQATKRTATAWTPWARDRQGEAARQRVLAEARARAAKGQVGGDVSPVGIPVIADAAILV